MFKIINRKYLNYPDLVTYCWANQLVGVFESEDKELSVYMDDHEVRYVGERHPSPKDIFLLEEEMEVEDNTILEHVMRLSRTSNEQFQSKVYGDYDLEELFDLESALDDTTLSLHFIDSFGQTTKFWEDGEFLEDVVVHQY